MTENTAQKPVVGIVMGSDSDWAVMQNAALVLKDMGVAYEARVVSAHRMPDEMFEYAETAKVRGIKCIIAGAGGAAHLPGMIAAKCFWAFPFLPSTCAAKTAFFRSFRCPRAFPWQHLQSVKPAPPMPRSTP